jgi:hypothetical protein
VKLLISIKLKGVNREFKSAQKKLKAEAELKKSLLKSKTLNALKEATPVDTGKAKDGWYSTDNEIKNDVEYIRQLNAGSSQQAPAYFVESTVLSQPGVKSSGIIVKYT